MSDVVAPPAPTSGPGDERSSNRRVAPIIVLVVALVIAGFFFILVRADPDTADSAYSPLLGKPAPSIRASTLEGDPFDLQQRKGSWVILNFFNVTCGPCVQEHPELIKFVAQQQAMGTAGAEFYSVVWNDLDGSTAEFFETNPVSWSVLVDDDADIAVKFGVAKVPETWIIDPNGYVVQRVISGLTDDQLSRFLIGAQTEYAAGVAPVPEP